MNANCITNWEPLLQITPQLLRIWRESDSRSDRRWNRCPYPSHDHRVYGLPQICFGWLLDLTRHHQRAVNETDLALGSERILQLRRPLGVILTRQEDWRDGHTWIIRVREKVWRHAIVTATTTFDFDYFFWHDLFLSTFSSNGSPIMALIPCKLRKNMLRMCVVLLRS